VVVDSSMLWWFDGGDVVTCQSIVTQTTVCRCLGHLWVLPCLFRDDDVAMGWPRRRRLGLYWAHEEKYRI
jgi:hypothetical protein